ncbi:MAG TPA: hypothetical protein VK762_27525 [Polyangiaceae bacterium]|nr:hypothetical protein [Polyangiaceae bacterium]
MAKRKLSARAERRSLQRATDKLSRDRQRLAYLEPGGTSARPIEVESASQVEPHALALSCVRCAGPNRLEEHAAVVVDGERLRVAKLACTRCGAARDVWFRLAPPLSN